MLFAGVEREREKEKWEILGAASEKRRQAGYKADEGVKRNKLRYILKSEKILNDFSDVFVLDWIIYTENE